MSHLSEISFGLFCFVFFVVFFLLKKRCNSRLTLTVPTKPTLIVKMVDIVVLKANVFHIHLQISFTDLNHYIPAEKKKMKWKRTKERGHLAKIYLNVYKYIK